MKLAAMEPEENWRNWKKPMHFPTFSLHTLRIAILFEAADENVPPNVIIIRDIIIGIVEFSEANI